jgi:hypothetical protein
MDLLKATIGLQTVDAGGHDHVVDPEVDRAPAGMASASAALDTMFITVFDRWTADPMTVMGCGESRFSTCPMGW